MQWKHKKHDPSAQRITLRSLSMRDNRLKDLRDPTPHSHLRHQEGNSTLLLLPFLYGPTPSPFAIAAFRQLLPSKERLSNAYANTGTLHGSILSSEEVLMLIQ